MLYNLFLKSLSMPFYLKPSQDFNEHILLKLKIDVSNSWMISRFAGFLLSCVDSVRGCNTLKTVATENLTNICSIIYIL